MNDTVTPTKEQVDAAFEEKQYHIDFTLTTLRGVRVITRDKDGTTFTTVEGTVRELDIYTILTEIATLPGVSVRRRDEMLNVYFNIKDDLRADPPV